MIDSDYKKIFRTLKDVNHQTELLELLDWDEVQFDDFNDTLSVLLTEASSIEHLLIEVTARYGSEISNFVKKLINSYVQDASEDHFIQGAPYEA